MKKAKELALVVTDDKSPDVSLAPGEKLEVIGVTLIDAGRAPVTAVAARLCSGGGTCVALMKVDE